MDDKARHRAEMPAGTKTIINARSLAASNRRLADLVRPGMAVLDVGCGTGAITRGIAEAVAPGGRVVGIDSNQRQVAQARQAHGAVAGLSFAVGDIYDLPYAGEFDLAGAARVLQWLADPAAAVASMVRALRAGGRLLVLDYNHQRIAWEPEPPASMRDFYAAFLRWRADADMDNAMADNLPAHFAAAGLVDICATDQREVARRGAADFAAQVSIWAEVAASRGHQMVRDGYVDEAGRARAEAEYRDWVDGEAQAQTLSLVAVEGVRPGR